MASAADVRAAFGRAAVAATGAGIDSSRWSLVEGSTTYGRAFRLVEVDPCTGSHSTPSTLWDTYLGMTRRDALHRLDGMRVAFGAVAGR